MQWKYKHKLFFLMDYLFLVYTLILTGKIPKLLRCTKLANLVSIFWILVRWRVFLFYIDSIIWILTVSNMFSDFYEMFFQWKVKLSLRLLLSFCNWPKEIVADSYFKSGKISCLSQVNLKENMKNFEVYVYKIHTYGKWKYCKQ